MVSKQVQNAYMKQMLSSIHHWKNVRKPKINNYELVCLHLKYHPSNQCNFVGKKYQDLMPNEDHKHKLLQRKTKVE